MTKAATLLDPSAGTDGCLSALLVRAHPQALDAVATRLQELPWLRVHFRDGQGRIIVTIEGETVGDEIARVTALQQTPGVLSVDLINHYFDRGEA
ncbi:MAG: chaperone NapD [Candidatus Schekmanbacteria bacterium]|nr:chaperone NapD [Candidatus Schekmanbacteria bacterium]